MELRLQEQVEGVVERTMVVLLEELEELEDREVLEMEGIALQMVQTQTLIQVLGVVVEDAQEQVLLLVVMVEAG
jgi:hypothetical protein